MAAKHKKRSSDGYWIWGVHACEAALNNPNRVIRRIVATNNAAKQLGVVHHGDARLEVLPPDTIARLLPSDAIHQGIALKVESLDPADWQDVLADRKTILVLDQVTDPHNVGAIMRSAAAFDVGAIILPKDHAPDEGGVLARAASGALDIVPVYRVPNLAGALKELKDEGYWIAGLAGEASASIDKAAEYNPLCLVLGAEGKGMRRLTRELCDVLLSIPISSRMESLNVSNAAAVALYAISAKGAL